jgi:hypothetical protein
MSRGKVKKFRYSKEKLYRKYDLKYFCGGIDYSRYKNNWRI